MLRGAGRAVWAKPCHFTAFGRARDARAQVRRGKHLRIGTGRCLQAPARGEATGAIESGAAEAAVNLERIAGGLKEQVARFRV